MEEFKTADDSPFLETVSAWISREDHMVTTLANLSSLIYHYLDDVSWCGFYLADGEDLYLGPFQGKPACTLIPKGKGVCGAAYESGHTLIVDDVLSFPGHIACDSASRSEIVVPLKGFGVLDLDSTHESRFTQREKELLEKVMKILSSLH
ncbi:MAG: GAF domain-containing protein [Bullifex sp.]